MAYLAGGISIGHNNVYISDGNTSWTFTQQETIHDIDRVVFNDPATIVFWDDGSKTVVKTSPNDKFDKEKGILWAFYAKHANGTKTKLQKQMCKLVGDEL